MTNGRRTVFEGTIFRSQLEVRWAIFFKLLGLKYEYEKESFGLLSGWYLPDFWLPRQKVWVEVKPRYGGDIDGIRYKELAVSTGFPLLCVQGKPVEGQYIVDVFAPGRNFRLREANFAEAERGKNRLLLVKEEQGCCWEVRRGAALLSLAKDPIKARSEWMRVASTVAGCDFSLILK